MTNRLLNFWTPLFLLLMMLGTLFLPHYQSWSIGTYHSENPTVLSTFVMPEAGRFAVISGFGSMFALLHTVLATPLTIFIIRKSQSITYPLVVGCIILGTKLLLLLGNSAGFGAPMGDSMLYGHYLFIICEIALIMLGFIGAMIHKDKHRKVFNDF